PERGHLVDAVAQHVATAPGRGGKIEQRAIGIKDASLHADKRCVAHALPRIRPFAVTCAFRICSWTEPIVIVSLRRPRMVRPVSASVPRAERTADLAGTHLEL